MAWIPGESLVIGISSRALFDLDEEDRVYESGGTQAFIDYQRAHEDDLIPPGVAFHLVQALVCLNDRLGTRDKPAIEIVLVSKNHPDCAIRIVRSLERHGIRLRRAVLMGGQPVVDTLRALEVDLFLSKNEQDVREALASGISAGLIYGGPSKMEAPTDVPVFAFDGDAVLFSDEADRVYREHMLAGFEESELKNASNPLPPGPLRRFAEALEELRAGHSIDHPPFRIVLVTARDFTYCERPMKTLRSWGIRVDEAGFVSDMPKSVMLAIFKPLIFFDDNPKNCADASTNTPTVSVPVVEVFTTSVTLSTTSERPERFAGVCKLFLKKNFGAHEATLTAWHDQHLHKLDQSSFSSFIEEFERSAKGTPAGRQRRSTAANDDDISKLMAFLSELLHKRSV